jgi:hypothetical protein
MMNLTEWQDALKADPAPVWMPHALTREEWPPDYAAVYRWRLSMVEKLKANKSLFESAEAYYSTRYTEFIMHWMDTYDPRKSPDSEDPELRGSKWMPFVFFTRQVDYLDCIHEARNDGENVLCEKSRDMGATWLACGYSVWAWRFIPNDAIGWGSRKQDLVDTIGDPDSLFEKMRLLINRLPAIWHPAGFTPKKHATFMKLTNPDNGSIIAGEAGDNIGRGGRKSMYFKDEAAHYERPEKIEAALGDNTNVQIDISSVNGLGNVFQRRREQGVIWQRGQKIAKGFTRVLIMDWRDHPNKTQAWYDARKAKYEREGMAHVFAQEVDRNYSAAVSNTVIPEEWIRAAVNAHIKVLYINDAWKKSPSIYIGGLDVADGGIDRNALCVRRWIVWQHAEEWGARDQGVTARRAIERLMPFKGRVRCMYDSIGVGSGVKTEYNRLTQDADPTTGVPILNRADIPFVSWNAGSGVIEPFNHIIPNDRQSPLNKDFYANIKAQAWWSLRSRFYKTWKAVTEGAVYPVDELISLDGLMPLLEQLIKELAQPTSDKNTQLKTLIEKTPEGTRSPNLADGGVMMYFPLPDNIEILVGSYG